VGKSRLLWESAHSSAMQGWRALEANRVSYGAAAPYLPVRELHRTLTQNEEAEDHIARAIVFFSGMGHALVARAGGARATRARPPRDRGPRERRPPRPPPPGTATERRRQTLDNKIRTRGLAILLRGSDPAIGTSGSA
jgi:hypothetical protein